MTTFLLTGAHGQLGKALLRTSPQLDILKPSRQELDLLNLEAVKDYFTNHKIDFVIHTAAKVGGIQSNVDDPVGYYAQNMRLNLNLIEAAFEAGIKDLINIGSSCMYPKDLEILREEDLLTAPLEPTNEGYALAKIAAAKHCSYLNTQRGTSYKTFIPCNLYGPDDNFDLESGHMLAAAIWKTNQAIEEGKTSIEIWGDGTARREFLYIDDLAGFIWDSVRRIEDLPDFLNVGFGKDFTVNQYYQTVADVLGYKGDFTHNLDRPVGMKHKLMNSSKAQEFGWSPSTGLEAGIRQTIEGSVQT